MPLLSHISTFRRKRPYLLDLPFGWVQSLGVLVRVSKHTAAWPTQRLALLCWIWKHACGVAIHPPQAYIYPCPLPPSSQAEPKSLPQRPDYLLCSVNISGFTPHTNLIPVWGMRVSFCSAENYGASTASWWWIEGPLKPLNLCVHLRKQKNNRVFPTIRVEDSAFSCHDSRVPLKPHVRKQCGHGWRLWMVGSRWQWQWLRDPGAEKFQKSFWS